MGNKLVEEKANDMVSKEVVAPVVAKPVEKKLTIVATKPKAKAKAKPKKVAKAKPKKVVAKAKPKAKPKKK